MKPVNDFGIWKIVAHIAFKFYLVASGTFSTGSTSPFSRPSERAKPACEDRLQRFGQHHRSFFPWLHFRQSV